MNAVYLTTDDPLYLPAFYERVLQDRARAEEGYDYYVEIYPQIPYASPNGIRSVLQFLAPKQPKAATAAPEDFYDMSFLKRIEESGFVKALYSKK